MIKDINAHGGVAGRKLVPIYAGFQATSSQTVDQQAQAACAKWTEDNEVFAILEGSFAIERQCAKDAGAVEFWGPTGSNSVPETFAQYPNYVELSGLNLVRLGDVTMDGLAKLGYFDKGAKIGVLTWDDPAYREGLKKGYIPALRQHGLELAADPEYITVPQTFQDLGSSNSDVNGAVLKFSSLGIDHVLILDGPAGLFGGAGLGFEFLNRAKSQQYYPRYGFNDNNQPIAGLKSGLYPTDQLKGSVAVAWLDGDKDADAGWRVNKPREECLDFMKKHGVDVGSVNAAANAIEACSNLWFLQDVVAKMGSAPLTVDNFMAGVNALGSSLGSPKTYAVHLGASQHDGVAAVRGMRFADSCKCYKFTSDPYKI